MADSGRVLFMRETIQCLDFQCPIQFVVDLIGNKWSILILRELFTGDRRTHELLTALPGKVLRF